MGEKSEKNGIPVLDFEEPVEGKFMFVSSAAKG